jgi:hypothetical protein
MIDEILESLKEEESAMIAPPASEKALDNCQKRLAEKGILLLPVQYLDFLKKTNGLAYGVVFFGTDPFPLSQNEDILQDIVSANEHFLEGKSYLNHWILLGETFDEAYIFNTKKERYEIVERLGHGVIDSFETFDELFDMATFS